jgi:hypothetical protein
MDEMLEALILGGANDDDIEEAVHHFMCRLIFTTVSLFFKIFV